MGPDRHQPPHFYPRVRPLLGRAQARLQGAALFRRPRQTHLETRRQGPGSRRRRAEGLPALAVQWGAIQDVGYLARNAAVNRALSQRLGLAALTAGEALTALETLLSRDPRNVNEAVVGFGRLEWSLVRKELAIARTPLFEDLQLDDAGAEGVSMAAEELLRNLSELSEAEVEARLADIIVENIARTLRLSGGDLDRNRALSEIGMDSLMMLELRMAVEEQMGIEIPLMSLTSSLIHLRSRDSVPMTAISASSAPGSKPCLK